jgi:uncharacterized RmlC-like cupin family protein
MGIMRRAVAREQEEHAAQEQQRRLHMQLVTIPPGGRAHAHKHASKVC